MRTNFPLSLLLLSSLILSTGCGREERAELKGAAQEAVAETVDAAKAGAAELAQRKLIEQQAEQSANADGAKVDVTLGDGNAMRIEGVDKDGRPVMVQTGATDISPAEAGLPFYPGAKLDPEGGTRSRNENFNSWMLTLDSADAPAKVSAFYRAEMAKLQGVKEVLDMGAGQAEGLHLMALFAQPNRGQSVIVEAAKEGGGSRISITRSEPATK